MFRFPLLHKNNIRDYVTIRGKEKLDALKEEGKGCILAATHCGNWEVEGAALALYGYPPPFPVAMQQKNKDFDRFLCEYRSMPGQKVEYKTGVRISAPTQGRILRCLLCDQDPGDTGILSPFLGQETLTATGPAHFSLLTGLPVMTAFIHETSPWHYEIIIGDPICADEGLKKKEAIKNITDKVNERLGKVDPHLSGRMVLAS